MHSRCLNLLALLVVHFSSHSQFPAVAHTVDICALLLQGVTTIHLISSCFASGNSFPSVFFHQLMERTDLREIVKVELAANPDEAIWGLFRPLRPTLQRMLASISQERMHFRPITVSACVKHSQSVSNLENLILNYASSESMRHYHNAAGGTMPRDT